jgi:hypothetical protein
MPDVMVDVGGCDTQNALHVGVTQRFADLTQDE